jgi:hypothetical protein
MSNLWQGLRQAQVFERGNYLSPGSYDLSVNRALLKQTQKSGLGFIVEFEVISSTAQAHPVGSIATWFQKMASPSIAFSAIKEFLLAVLNLDPRRDIQTIGMQVDPVIETIMDHVVSEANPLSGMFVHAEAFQTLTQKGTDFTAIRWTPFDFAGASAEPPDIQAILALGRSPVGRTPIQPAPMAPPPPPPPAFAPPPPSEVLSPDGRHVWDGRVWKPRT